MLIRTVYFSSPDFLNRNSILCNQSLKLPDFLLPKKATQTPIQPLSPHLFFRVSFRLQQKLYNGTGVIPALRVTSVAGHPSVFHQATNPSHSTTSFKDNKQTNQTADCHWFKPSLTEQAIKTKCCSEYLNTSYTSTFVIRKNISQLETLTTKDYKSTKTHKAVSEIFLLQYLK